MRELIAHTYCDICRGELDTQTEVDETHTIRVVFEGKAKRLDPCDTHSNPTWQQITAYWFDDLDVLESPNGRKHDVHDWPKCRWCAKRAQSPHGLLTHGIRMHKDIPLQEIQRAYGFPVTDRNIGKLGRPKAEESVRDRIVTCPHCDATYQGPAPLGQHLKAVHGMDSAGRDAVFTELFGRPTIKRGAHHGG